jgi:hypothetical protein
MKDVIRLARQAHHYLAIFDKGRAIGLYHTKRLASPRQRIVLYAKRRFGYAPLDRLPVSRFESCRGHHLSSAYVLGCKIRATASAWPQHPIGDTAMTTTPIPLPPGAVHVEKWEVSADERVTRSFRGTAYTAAAIKGGGLSCDHAFCTKNGAV